MIDESPIAKSNPEIIRYARVNNNLTDEDIEKFYNNYKKWETGEKPTTWNDLRLIAKIYHKPTFYYFLQKPPSNELKEYTLIELFEKFNTEFEKFKEELNDRLKIYQYINMDDDL